MDETLTQAKLLYSILSELSSRCEQLLETLALEHTIFKQKPAPDAANAIVQQKQQSLQHIELLEKKLQTLFNTHDPQQLSMAIQHFSEHAPEAMRVDLRLQWQQLKSLLINCQHANLRSGNIVHANLNFTRRLLSILVPEKAHKEIYDESGRLG